MNRQQHWEAIYTTRGERDVSWFEAMPAVSIEMMEAAGLTRETCVLDVGGGDSHLVDQLAARGLDCLAVLDVSRAALHRAQVRLGAAAAAPTWIEADVTADWSLKPMDIWHDRAVFHFLTEADDRARYRARLDAVLKPGGAAILATFAFDGPPQCSGLPVARYTPESLAAELGDGFVLAEARRHVHQTPQGAMQAFQYSRFRKVCRARSYRHVSGSPTSRKPVWGTWQNRSAFELGRKRRDRTPRLRRDCRGIRRSLRRPGS